MSEENGKVDMETAAQLPHTSLYQYLRSGKGADVVLWRRRNAAISILVVATTLWFLFECCGYSLLSLVANVFLLLITILFVWSNAASVLNRPPPSVPVLKVSEETINKISATMRENINYGLKVWREFALGKDLKLFLKVAFVLLILSTAGACFNFLTLVYICVLVSLTLPAFCNKHRDCIDRYAEITRNEIRKRYEMFDAHVSSKIPRVFSKKTKVL
ncbi:reticulon-like protein B6 isoform X1 [Cryptomeria japonica]|uniref:reticulon-like protein B6 isoform X1 n=1 Tax=Cryptomeria japonica TaxID=3369 RepID=UPI0027DA983E|nr:reticulon-like protein B6 isoform X1 [Cryptomeria japonica]